jgi:hypothetical protein
MLEPNRWAWRPQEWRAMPESHPTDFICPGCGSDYKVVRVKAEADLPQRLIHCKVCKQPLAPIHGEYVLKYFLVRRAKAKRLGIGPERG